MNVRANDPRAGPSSEVQIVAVDGAAARTRFDRVATEEPLEIRLQAGLETRSLAITMRTPGNDFELAAGFLYSEGVVARWSDVANITYCVDPGVPQQYNTVNVELAARALPALDRLERHFTITSACGVCGKGSIEAMRARGLRAVRSEVSAEAAKLLALPDRLRKAQGVFERTGGLHAAALFDASGELVAAREDVGRHNAMDKLIGWAFLQRRLPLGRGILLVSGRASYELVQKAVAAGAPMLCAVSAPSSLAVDLAREFGVTLLGFLRGSRFNVYANPHRIRGTSSSPA